jgi:alpha-glucosidase
LWEGFTGREVYLPAGDWFDYWTGKRYKGGVNIHVGVTIESIPIFVRAGGFIFRQPVVQSTGEMAGKPLRVLMAPAAESQSTLYEDDGEDMQYRKGNFMKRTFHQTTTDGSTVVEVSAPEGKYRPASRDLVLEMWNEREPRSIALQTGENAAEDLPHLGEKASRGWSFSNGILMVKIPDPFAAAKIKIQY